MILSSLVVLLFLVLAFFGSSSYVNRRTVPPELMNPPREMVSEHPLTITIAPTAAENIRTLADSVRRDSNQPRARDLLEILRRFEDRKDPLVTEWGNASYYPEITIGTNVWEPGRPLKPKMLDWLAAHRDFTDKCLGIAEHSQVPKSKNDPITPDVFRSLDYNFDSILNAEAQSCLERGDLARAERITMALTALSWELNQRFLSSYMLTRLISDDLLTTESLKKLRPMLADFHRQKTSYTMADSTRDIGLDFRRYTVERLNAPWQEYLGASLSERRYRFDLNIPLIYVRNLPNPRPIVVDSLTAMAEADSFKRQGPALLRQFDGFWPKVIACAKLSYPELVNHPPLDPPWAKGSFPDQLSDYYGRGVMRDQAKVLMIGKAGACESEARINLLRAAIEWRLNPDSAPRDSLRDMASDRDSPWRDPFTEHPLRVEQATSSTLIYSLGPDLIDQHGIGPERLIIYGGGEPVYAKGDISIRLKSRAGHNER